MHVFHTFRTESIRPVFGVYHPVDEAFRQSKGREADLVQLTVRYRYDNSNTEPNWLHVGSWAIHEHRIFSFYYFFVVVFLFLAAGKSFPSTCFGHRVKAIDFIQYTENISFYQKWERHNTTHTHTLAVLVCIARVVIMYPCWIQTFKHIIIIWLVDSSFVPAKCSMQCPIKPNNEQKKNVYIHAYNNNEADVLEAFCLSSSSLTTAVEKVGTRYPVVGRRVRNPFTRSQAFGQELWSARPLYRTRCMCASRCQMVPKTKKGPMRRQYFLLERMHTCQPDISIECVQSNGQKSEKASLPLWNISLNRSTIHNPHTRILWKQM